jgi:deferrochelatase/peroxidase EfeB
MTSPVVSLRIIDYITPVGGGYFFAPPGAHGPTDWVGSGLFV